MRRRARLAAVWAITLDAIRDFGKQTWGKYGNEPPEAFPFTGPTPGEPTISSNG